MAHVPVVRSHRPSHTGAERLALQVWVDGDAQQFDSLLQGRKHTGHMALQGACADRRVNTQADGCLQVLKLDHPAPPNKKQ
eukprot:1143774-Pelagomonas_calceolata.AAC.2